MDRTCFTFLNKWLASPRRKPLVIRGARQVGKTWLVRHLAKVEGRQLVELNLEKHPEYAALFSSNEPAAILRNLEQKLSIKIDPENSLLFLDEIQEQPDLFAKLRWFYEDMPQLPVVAAGSLLEFVLGSYQMSMPVGRVNYMYLEPLSFIEFLMAANKEALVELIKTYSWEDEINSGIHDELVKLFKEYVFVGGLPEAVESWVTRASLEELSETHADLVQSYRNDFGDYSGRINTDILDEVLDAIPSSLGNKFVYSSVNPTVKIATTKKALNLLSQARVCHKVKCTAANGLPLGAEVNTKFLKVILLDVGLCSSELGLKLYDLQEVTELSLVNKGGIAEQVVGQLLRTIEPCYVEPKLYYWLRTRGNSSAEIDYVIQHNSSVIPLEVKAGSVGKMKSLHAFMGKKKLPLACRVYAGLPLIDPIDVKDTEGNPVQYQLRSIPFYLMSELHRLLD